MIVLSRLTKINRIWFKTKVSFFQLFYSKYIRDNSILGVGLYFIENSLLNNFTKLRYNVQEVGFIIIYIHVIIFHRKLCGRDREFEPRLGQTKNYEIGIKLL